MPGELLLSRGFLEREVREERQEGGYLTTVL